MHYFAASTFTRAFGAVARQRKRMDDAWQWHAMCLHYDRSI
jgi:hypothetical protein